MRTVSIGKQDYESLIMSGCFYVDKTYFIKQWWESQDDVTLITRPRRFGKTLNMSMINCFFSNKYAGRGDLFEGLSIWKNTIYRKIQGTYPVIFLSFADVKETKCDEAIWSIKDNIATLYMQHYYLLKSDALNDDEKLQFQSVNNKMSDVESTKSIRKLCEYLYKYYGKKVIILLDEYDTPLQEAYVNGYWEEIVNFIRSLFNSTFKTNPYLDRAIMTGITRVSKESMFSDLNNLNVVTATSNEYATCFGFTEKEVFASLDEAGLSDKKEIIKKWYDGFTFGKYKDIYNPWSITCYLDKKELRTYWVSTSSNSLVSKLIQTGSPEIKKTMEMLLEGEDIKVSLDEQIVFNQLYTKKNAIWSLLLASGYLKVENVDLTNPEGENIYELSLTNFEVKLMFESMIKDWFEVSDDFSDEFVKALIIGDIKAMNYFMNKIALSTFSYFDVGNKPSESAEPERFYHGFVLGLMVGQRKNYVMKSNRESGFGRYDIMMIPRSIKDKKFPAIIIEFKVHDSYDEKSLEDTVAVAHKQIKEKRYDEELLNLGIEKERIRHYGFAFEGKKVLIG